METCQTIEKPKEKIFTIDNLHEIGKWINYLGDTQCIEFAEPIYDQQGKILVQKDSILKENIYKSLQSRKSSEFKNRFVFKYNKKFMEKCKNKISNSLYVCLDAKRYHIAPQFMIFSKNDYTQIGDILFENRELLDHFIKLDMDGDPILPHLGEIALVCTGFTDLFLEKAKRTSEKKEILKLAFACGLLHDISLQGDFNFLYNDLENYKNSDHEVKSQLLINQTFKNLDPLVGKIIRHHHRETPIYPNDDKVHFTKEMVISECLNFSEYLFSQIRMPYLLNKKNLKISSTIQKIFFNVGQIFGKGFFHPFLFEILAILQKKFLNVMKFGEDIGNLEACCIFKDSAVAYPSPRCTQILCKDKKYNCKLVSATQPIDIIAATKTMGWAGMDLSKGKYPKCKLSKKLPPPPKELDGISYGTNESTLEKNNNL
jgi:hypothetical protein